MKMFKIISLLTVFVLLMNVGAASTATDFKKCVDVAKNNKNWKVLITSESANFENSNTVLNYHIVNHNNIKVRTSTGKTYMVTWEKLNKKECFFYKSVPRCMFKTDGSLSGNFQEMRDNYLRGK